MDTHTPDLDESAVKEFMNRLPDITNNPRAVNVSMLAARSRKARQFMGIKVHDLVVEREETYAEALEPIDLSVVRGIYNDSSKELDVFQANQREWKSRWFNRIYNFHLLQQLGKFDYARYDEKLKVQTVHQIPTVCMGIFCCVSPRDIIKAFASFEKDNIQMAIRQTENDLVELGKHNSRFFGHLHKHRCEQWNFLTVDIDEPEIYKDVYDMLTPFKKWGISQTSRGYHIVLDLSKEQDCKDFYGGQNTGIKLQDATHFKLEEKFKGKFDWQNNAQEPVWGTLYYKDATTLNYVKIIE